MPTIVAVGHTVTVGVTPGQIVITSEIHNLQSVALRPCTDSAVPLLNTPAHHYGMVYLASIVTPTPVPRILLCAGYFGYYHNLSWDGNIRLEPSDCIFAIFYSQLACAAELVVRTELT